MNDPAMDDEASAVFYSREFRDSRLAGKRGFEFVIARDTQYCITATNSSGLSFNFIMRLRHIRSDMVTLGKARQTMVFSSIGSVIRAFCPSFFSEAKRWYRMSAENGAEQNM